MSERPPSKEIELIVGKEVDQEKEKREQERRVEEERIREAELPYHRWGQLYAQVHSHIVPDYHVIRNFKEEVVNPTIDRFRQLERMAGSDTNVLKFRDETLHLLQSLGFLTQERHTLARIYQAFGRAQLMNPMEARMRIDFGHPAIIAALWKESLRGLPRSKKAVGRLGAWIQRNSHDKVNSEIWKITNEPPQLFRYDAGAYHEVDLPEAVQEKLPKDFFDDPTRFIENISVIERRRHPTSRKYATYQTSNQIYQPYDARRVRLFEDVIFKRVDLQLVEEGTKEISVSEKIRQELEGKKLNIKVPKYHGVVYDHGNIYLVSENIPNSVNLAERTGYEHVLKQLTDAGLPQNPSDILVQYRTPEMKLGDEVGFWLVDFEGSLLASKEEAHYEKSIPQTHAPHIERAPNGAEIVERSERYNAQGITVNFARELPMHIETEHEAREGKYEPLSGLAHLEVFYLNSSDSIEVLERQIDVSGEHVITVGGNGDFAKIFLEKGAQKIDIFDLSLPAVFYNELCMVALQELDFESYKEFVNFWKINEGRAWENRFDFLSIFDAQIYRALRPFLSEQACAYFDELIKHPDLFQEKGGYYHSFAESRQERHPGGRIFTVIDDLIQNEVEYGELQKKARTAEVSFSWVSANAMAEHTARANRVENFPQLSRSEREALFSEQAAERFAGADTVYLSNIDYNPAGQIKLAKLFIRAGVSRVLFSVSAERLGYEEGFESFLESSHEFLDLAGNVLQKDPYSKEGNEWFKQHRQEVCKLVRFKGEPVLPGNVIDYEGTKLRVIGYSDRVEFGMIVELQNPPAPPVPSEQAGKKEGG